MRPNTEPGRDRQSIIARVRDASLFGWTTASAVYVVMVYVAHCSSLGTSADKASVSSLSTGDRSAAYPREQDVPRDRSPFGDRGALSEQGSILENEDRIREAHRMDEEIRDFVIEKYSHQRQPVPGDEVFNEHRVQRILEISSQLEGVTDYPEGSLQWQRRNRLEQLETNQNH